MAQLSIYKASAGSGKTFTLAFEYLLHLIRDPYAFRRILAVTFTNKATGEMKSRIVNELNNLANGNPSPYLDDLVERSSFSSGVVRERAQLALNLLLNDFSRFSVETIDKFFNRVLQSFTREIGLQTGFNLELDVMKIMNESVDEMLFSLPDNESLKEWLVNFAEAKIQDGKSWNIKYDILNAGREIFKEKFKLFSKHLVEKLNDKKFLEKYISYLNESIYRFENKLQTLGKQGIKLIEEYDLRIEDFKHGKSGFANHFRKLAEKKDFIPGTRTRNAANDLSSWYTGKSDNIEAIDQIYEGGLNKILTDSIHFFDYHSEDYQTSLAISRHIYTLGILTDLTKQVREHCMGNNLFLISDVAGLLNEIIEGNDAPFIYEKTGSFFQYFMIDEFQDTSWVQWQNFRPLLTNSLAQDHDCLVVGDVKQSIYRWRNSDWNILAEQVNKDFKAPWTKIHHLDTNWRSQGNIIRFNNLFFKEAAQFMESQFEENLDQKATADEQIIGLSGKITNAYEDTVQKISDSTDQEGGYIRISLFSEKEKDWRKEVEKELPSLVNKLIDKGYFPGDIAILVRNNKDGKDIVTSMLNHKSKADTLQKHQYEILSNESLFLENSSAVLLIISVLGYLFDPDDRLNAAFMLAEFNRYFNQKYNTDTGLLEQLSKETGVIRELIEGSFPQAFIDILPVLPHLPLYELIERIIDVLRLPQITSEVPFIQAFQDCVIDFVKTETSDLQSFLEWWKQEGAEKTITISEQQNAIRVLTIHKAKGLEFPVVIVPYCNWTLDHNTSLQNIIWCEPTRDPYSQLDLVPVNYSSKLAGTIFYKDYYTEKLHAYVDNLNLLYVAFTRAIEKLYVFGTLNSRGGKQVGDLMHQVIQIKLMGEENEEMQLIPFDKSVHWDETKMQLSVGQESNASQALQRSIDQTVRQKEYPDFAKNRLHLKLHKSDYFLLDDDTKMARINEGNLMHELFEYIITADDIDPAVNRLIMKGKISADYGEELKVSVKNKLEDPMVQDWFNKNWNIKTEADILLKNEKVRRPDRVMLKENRAIVVDYKFGEVEEESYKSQMRKYLKYLVAMGYVDVKGFIWYVNLEKKIEVFL